MQSYETCVASVYLWPPRQEQIQIVYNFVHKTASYIIRKGFTSFQLQPVCDDNLRLLDKYTGWPESVADARVFRKSPLRAIFENGNLDEEYHLLGDSGYGIVYYMMVPFSDNTHLSKVQINYKCHSSERGLMERAFNFLKSRLGRLQYLDMRLVEKSPLVMLSSGVLHNFILFLEKMVIDIDVHNIQIGEQALHEDFQEQYNIVSINKRNTR